jgi:iron complex transport system substrate-binding protein
MARAVVAVAATTAATATATVIDDIGQRVTLPNPPRRIISLAPGATEMLFAAGAGDRLIATVGFSDEPAAAKRVPRIGDVTAIDMERLVALHPDLVVAWPGGGNPAQIEKIAQMGIPIYRWQVNRLADLPDSLRRLGVLTGDEATAGKAASALAGELERITREYGGGRLPGGMPGGGAPASGGAADGAPTASAPAPGGAAVHAPVPGGAAIGAPAADARPTVLLEVWNRPIYTVGGTHLMSDALTLCGVRNVFGDLKELGPIIDTEAVIARDPDIIVAAAPPSEGASWLAEWKRFGSLKAVRTGRLVAFEDQRLSRLGPSVVLATEALCKALATSGSGGR